MDALAKRILDQIKHNVSDSILPDYPEDREMQITKENFIDLIKLKNNKALYFVDGGNLEIFRSPSMSLFFNRIYTTGYKDNKRISNRLFEFYSLIHTLEANHKIILKAELQFTKGAFDLKDYEFDSYDASLSRGRKRVEVSSVGNVIRRFSELTAASLINDNESAIILDGSLDAAYTFEPELITGLYNSGKNICALSKTSELITGSGDSVCAYLRRISPAGAWIYRSGKLPRKGYGIDQYFIKLLPKSEYVFRFEVFDNCNYNIQELASALSENSRDPVFYGYPYGLVEADKLARVSMREAETLKFSLLSKFGKDAELMKPYLNSMNAHDKLDSQG